MRKLFFLLLTAALTSLGASALTVQNTAGQLSQRVQDTQITQLTVTGTMDARDFLFITNELTELTSLNLAQVTIEPVNGGQVLYGTVTSYVANEIPRTAFFGKKLTSVTLPATTQSIGYAAFAGCYQLRSVTLPASVTFIDDYAFAGTALTSVDIPETVLYMGKGVYSRCEQLQSVVVNGANVGDYAFLGAIQLSSVQLGSKVKSIGKGAFNGCTALTTINIDPACKMSRIDDEAFINSGLQSIDIKNLGLGTIGDWAFAQTQLRRIALTDGMRHLGEGALAHNRLLQYVFLPGMGDGTTSHDLQSGNDFKHYAGPKLATPRPSLTLENISDYAFAGDEVLHANKMLSRGVATIGNYAFYNVSAEMDTMFLPATVAYLGDYAMAGMTGMRVLKTAAEEVPALGENVWAGVDQPSVPVIAPNDESVELYKAADQWMNFFFKPSFIPGDVNGDGTVNISDITMLINYLLTGNATGVDMLAADLTGDNNVNISDATALISMISHGSAMLTLPEIYAAHASVFSPTGDLFVIPPFTLRAGEQRTINVALNNNGHVYTAMECEVVLPEGVTLAAVEGVDRGAGHEFTMVQHEQETNVYTVIGVSMNMACFNGDEGNVLRLTLVADDDFSPSNAEVQMTNVVLVTPKHQGYLANDALGRVLDATGVEVVTADSQIASVRYINLAGQESSKPFSGMNIVVTTYTDGTTSTMKIMK